MNFSVIMAVYKNDNVSYFERALESISIDQTVKPKQIVVIQDGKVSSKIDEIITCIENKCTEIEFSVLKKDKNEGLAAALNDGIALCKYDWIARMDADDISIPNRFELQIKAIENNRDIAVIGGDIAEFNEVPGDLHSERHVGKTIEDIRKMAKKRTPLNHVTVMYLKSAVLQVGGYSVDFGKLEDYKLWVDLIASEVKIVNINNILVNVRVGSGFTSRRSNKREIYDWDNLQKYLISTGIVTPFEALMNRLYIRGFTYLPGWIKRVAYKFLLRG